MAAPSIVLFRRDFRLADNPALNAASERGGPVILLHVRETDDPQAGSLGGAQDWWWHHALASLAAGISEAGNTLVLRTGSQNAIVEELIATTGADAVFWNRRYHLKGRETDAALKTYVHERGIEAKSFSASLLHEPSRLLTGAGNPYRVYTPFWKAFSAGAPLPEPLLAPETLPLPVEGIKTESLAGWNLLPQKPDWASGFAAHWQPGEQGARTALDRFIDQALVGYKEYRDFPAVTATSRLSPHLASGDISSLQVWQAIHAAEDGIADDDSTHFRKELCWREFCWHLLFHQPDLPEREFNPRFSGFDWGYDEPAFAAWTRGLTGYPIVDAGMRELWQTGWMHNRVRMIVASFLIKDLMIDWRHGERWFRDTLVDADPASNAANWQWVAGCGADAAPYFRIFNPVLQGEKFDTRGDYVRRYVTEIARLPDKYIHRPYEAPKAILQEAGIRLGETYPEPIVDHAFARQRALAAYKAGSDAES